MRWWKLSSGEWFEWTSPWWLLLIILIIAGFFLRHHKYYLAAIYSYLYTGTEKGRIWTKIRFALPSFFTALLLLSIVLALVDFTRAYVSVKEEFGTHRIFVALDASSSMYNFTSPHDSITCKTTAYVYPRIHGGCRALYRLVDEVEKFSLGKDSSNLKDLIGIDQFAKNSYVISYLTSDYNKLRKRIDDLEWKSTFLGINTNIHLGMWDMYLMALERNLRRGSFTHLTGKELRALTETLNPKSSFNFRPPESIKEKLEKIKKEFKDTD